MYRNFQELIEKRFKDTGTKRRIAVVRAEDEHTLQTVIKASEAGLVEPVLIGDGAAIREILAENKIKDGFEIIQADGQEECVEQFVKMAVNGDCQAVMKGNMDSKVLLKALVDKKNNLLSGKMLSSASIYEIPTYHKLLCITDAGINLYPDYEQKKQILKNAISAMRNLGYEEPKAGVLCAVEKVNPKMPETIDARNLQEACDNGEFGKALVCGPISFDLCVNREAAEVKNFLHPVAGDADIILADSICTGNALTKSLTFCAGATACALLLGAKIPVVFTSRASSLETKYRSIIAAIAMNVNKTR